MYRNAFVDASGERCGPILTKDTPPHQVDAALKEADQKNDSRLPPHDLSRLHRLFRKCSLLKERRETKGNQYYLNAVILAHVMKGAFVGHDSSTIHKVAFGFEVEYRKYPKDQENWRCLLKLMDRVTGADEWRVLCSPLETLDSCKLGNLLHNIEDRAIKEMASLDGGKIQYRSTTCIGLAHRYSEWSKMKGPNP